MILILRKKKACESNNSQAFGAFEIAGIAVGDSC